MYYMRFCVLFQSHHHKDYDFNQNLDCSTVKLGQFMAFGQPKNIVLTGFPKSGALWIKGAIDNFLPYYFWLETISVCKAVST